MMALKSILFLLLGLVQHPIFETALFVVQLDLQACQLLHTNLTLNVQPTVLLS